MKRWHEFLYSFHLFIGASTQRQQNVVVAQGEAGTPGSVVTRGEGAQTQKLSLVMSPGTNRRALQSETAWNVLRIQEKNPGISI